jgi:hypothetical protein
MSAHLNDPAGGRETWITCIFRDGTTLRYWGDPEEAIDWDEFGTDPEQDKRDYEDQIADSAPDYDWEWTPGEPGAAHEARPPEPKAPARSKPIGKPTPTLAIRMADIESEAVEWLWHPYISLGKLTSVEGDPGVGKSWLTMALAAQVSRGAKLPGASRVAEPGAVLLLTAEDGPGDTLRPRLDTLGADVSRVHAITEPLAFTIEGTARLEAEITRLGTVLVIIDPIAAYLPDRTDMNNASAVRPVLMNRTGFPGGRFV